MCIVIIKPFGVDLPSPTILKNCWTNNRHGAGMMFDCNDEVVINKGFMTYNDFENKLEELKQTIDLKMHTMIFHFRISTSGRIDSETCHPYPISTSVEDLRNTNIITQLGVAHNGTIRVYNGVDKILNDTQLFIKNDLYSLYSLDSFFYFNSNCQSMIERLIDGSRMVFLNGTGAFVKIGNWIKHTDGCYYSNNSFNKYQYTKATFSKHFQKIEDILNEEYEINNEKSNQEDYEVMLDYLEHIPYDKVVYTNDGLDEYSWKDDNIYIDTIDKSIYYVDSYSISYLGHYCQKEDLL